MNVSTLRPGLLVGLKTSITGNTQYAKTTIEADHVLKSGAKRAVWETQRTVLDPEEAEKARKLRGDCYWTISRLCVQTAFGLLCPENKREELDAAVREAHANAKKFNAAAKLTNIRLYVIIGRVAPDDVEAIRAINSEVRDLISVMESGVRNLDVKAIRSACNKVQAVGRMLSPEAEAKIKKTIEVARKSAREIAKAGEEAAQIIDRATIKALRQSRTAFLDLDDNGTEVQAPTTGGRAVDLEPENEPELPLAARPVGNRPELEM